MRTFFLLLYISSSSNIFAQQDYRSLSHELIRQALINHIFTEASFSAFEREIDNTPEDQLNVYFVEKAKKNPT